MTHSGERESLPRFAELDGDYEIVRELGRGGTAVVYLAHERMLSREVAIKVIRSTYMEDPEAMGRLMREARTVGRMQHPNIVVLYGTRRLGDGSLALIMQYVPGRTLRREIQEAGGLPFDRVHRILTDLCRALAYAHRQLIVHRDIKPENIYLDDDSGIARLSDFGIARSWAAESELTLPGTAIGTPAYMSPEQIDGGEVDGRSDLYSLGLVGYEMLTGTRPWAGENLYAMIAKQKNEELTPLADRRPGIPPALQVAVEGALRKDRNQRWQTAGEFLAALGSAPDAERVETPSPFAELIAIRPQKSAPAPATAPPAAPSTPENNETVVWRAPAVEDPADEPVWEPTAEEPAPARSERPDRRRRRSALMVAGVLLVAAVATVALMLALRQTTRDPTAAATDLDTERGPQAANSPIVQVAAEPLLPLAADTTAAATDPAASGDTSAAASSRAALVYVVFGDGQRGAAGTVLPKPLMVRVVDSAGRAVEGATVRFNVTAGDGSVQPTMGITNQDGVAATRWLPRTIGVHRALARVDGLDAAPLVFRAQALPGTMAPSRTASSPAAEDPVRSYSNAQREPMPFAPDQRGAAPAAVGAATWPLPVRRTVAAGGRHTCALGGNGTAVCWGGSDTGQLGGRPATGPGDPVRVAAPEPFAVIAAGVIHTCAVAVSGAAYCWGGNSAGQLGDGTRVSRALPARARLADRLTAITVGLSHSCALDGTGRISCWGQNHRGQLGDRTTSDRSLGVRVAGRRTFRSVVAGWTHTCALTPDGAAYCWGSNRYGELGTGGNADRAEPAAVVGGHHFTTIAAGHRFTCGLRADGAVLCWGENSHGQLGNGTTAHSSEPVEVLAADRFTDLAAGGAHACAISWDGPAFCWGENSHGQLGDGSVQSRLSPSTVAGGHRFSAISASVAHTCGMTGGRSFCWGSNREGQVGGGPRTVQTRAAAVTDLPGDG